MSNFSRPVVAKRRQLATFLATALAVPMVMAPTGTAQAQPVYRDGYGRADRDYGRRDNDRRDYDRDDYPVHRNAYRGEVIHNYRDNQFQLALPGGGYLRVTARPD